MLGKLFTVVVVASTAFAHSNMFTPAPREDRSNAFTNANNNGCESGKTNIPGQNTFARGQKVPVEWWWNNHSGGFIKMALIQGVPGNVDGNGKKALLSNENIIQGQCYTRKCNRNGFDPGNTKKCQGAPVEIPDWVADGTYVLQWSHFGGYDSEGVPTRQLPIYHTCANIRIKGGKPLQKRPNNWIAPFFGGDEVKINGKSAAPNQCAFKNFNKEPADPKVVNVKDDNKATIKFGGPDGWAAVGRTNKKRNEEVRLPRLGHVARNASPSSDAEDDVDEPVVESVEDDESVVESFEDDDDVVESFEDDDD